MAKAKGHLYRASSDHPSGGKEILRHLMKHMKKFRQKAKDAGSKLLAAMEANAKEYNRRKLERGCELCGEKNVCPDCYRCYSWRCNAGCISCIGIRGPRWPERRHGPTDRRSPR
jgi:hypothetical protein